MRKIGIFVILTIIVNLITPDTGMSQQGKNAPAEPPVGPYKVVLPLISNEFSGYFVSPAGDDANPGTFLKPWRTIGKAARTVMPGDLVIVRGGVYNEAVILDRSGTNQKPIKFKAFPGETPVIEGNNQLPTTRTALFYVKGDWIIISGFEVRNSTYSGVHLRGQHDVADQIFSHHNQKQGIYVQGDYGTVQNSYIWRNALLNEYNKAGNGSAALSTSRDDINDLTDYAILRNNTVWENWGIGIDTYESNGIVIEGNIVHDNLIGNIYISDATNILCKGNFVYMTQGYPLYGRDYLFGIQLGDELYTPPSANITIINNILYGNTQNFHWTSGERQTGGMMNVLIANNTFVNSSGGLHSNVAISDGTHQNVRFMNNIIVQDDSAPIEHITINPQVVVSHNLWSKHPHAEIMGAGDIVGDPKLARTGALYSPEWFRLTASSPAIDQALVLPEVAVDYFMIFRGNIPDIGAIEYEP